MAAEIAGAIRFSGLEVMSCTILDTLTCSSIVAFSRF